MMMHKLAAAGRHAVAAVLVAVLSLPYTADVQAAQRKANPVASVKKTQAIKPKPKRSAQKSPTRMARSLSPQVKTGAAASALVHPKTSLNAGSLAGMGTPAWADGQEEASWLHEGLRLHSNAVLVLDADTNAVLLHKNENAVLPIASLTKLMTALVVVDAGLPMDEVLTITEDDVDRLKGSGSRLAVGTRLTRAEVLHLALMASENRAAHALGRTFPGGVAAFVAAMNNKAHELGLAQTRFVEPTGLSSDNRSSPRDLARLVAVASRRPLLRELSVSPEYELADGRRVVHYRNSNKLVRESDWDILLQKTGYIREAGRCVAMQVRLAGRNVIMVLMNASHSAARWADAEQLLQWLQRSLVGSAAAAARL